MFTPYSANELSVAYQLRWSLAVFLKAPLTGPIDWVDELSRACEPDGIRVLEAKAADNNTLFLLVSTQPHVIPKSIVQRVKGRLQHLLRKRGGIEWRRNFRLSAVGDANARSVDDYIATQLKHHSMASSTAQVNLAAAQWHEPSLELTKPVNSGHGQYALALHVVLVHAERWCNAERDFVELTSNAIRSTLLHRDCPAGRIAILADHVHISLRLHYEVSPSALIVDLMNEVWDAHGGQRLWMEGYYVGTIGPYNMNPIRRNRRASLAPPSLPRCTDDYFG